MLNGTSHWRQFNARKLEELKIIYRQLNDGAFYGYGFFRTLIGIPRWKSNPLVA